MSEHHATVTWERGDAVFTDRRYSRAHEWQFDGGASVGASASPHVVPHPYSVASAVDPEEAFVVALSSCHMLWFLDFAARRGFVVDEYRDTAVGKLGPDSEGKPAMLEVTLRPEVRFSGKSPLQEELDALHHDAHESCFLARSVKTVVRIL